MAALAGLGFCKVGAVSEELFGHLGGVVGYQCGVMEVSSYRVVVTTMMILVVSATFGARCIKIVV